MPPRSTSRTRSSDHELANLLDELRNLHTTLEQAATDPRLEHQALNPGYRASAQNLLAYLALRRQDLHRLQLQLSAQGLSSLGRSEAAVLPAVATLIDTLERLLGHSPTTRAVTRPDNPLAQHARALFGVAPRQREVRIMVTLPGEAADDYSLVRDLLAARMDCVRINCAHDEPATWARMIKHTRRASAELEQPCKIFMDLPGPKLRTGPIAPGPTVCKVKPERDRQGRVRQAARVWLTGRRNPRPAPSSAAACLQVGTHWLSGLQAGDRIRLVDTRQARRQLEVIEVTTDGCWVEAYKTSYLAPGLRLTVERDGRRKHSRIGEFAPQPDTLRLAEGDLLILTADQTPGRPASHDSSGRLLTPATLGCTLPQVFADVRAGEPVWFDDGKLGGVVERATQEALRVRITHAPGGVKLKGDKGINFPQSALRLAALGEQDLAALAFAAEQADGVELSFVNTADDVQDLLAELDRLQADRLAMVLKIETRRGFDNLPALLLAGMRRGGFGVMIARGDLAVEGGFERLAALQEDILCLCEAAQVPVIWATQVLENLAKKGSPSRAEITDAATGVRAECVMLNKGPHILKAVATLDELLVRMQGYNSKKRQLLRKLQLASPWPD
ncbi:pyruvate kinase [Pseudomonas oryzihabitans]|uniref:pyruvate kinase n=1 Tax=Pseudomonas oryzihabitans TaxID=47885 RepID=UPI002867121B|nr:pyruvate kinase [Pseudomonas psychrotolerans]MDR6679981.1 pyruvate kinase [Pseudomonas psychrotolerans]